MHFGININGNVALACSAEARDESGHLIIHSALSTPLLVGSAKPQIRVPKDRRALVLKVLDITNNAIDEMGEITAESFPVDIGKVEMDADGHVRFTTSCLCGLAQPSELFVALVMKCNLEIAKSCFPQIIKVLVS